MQLLKFSKSVLNFPRLSNLSWIHLNCATVNDAADPNENLIISNTVVCSNHLTPELKLRLITPECKLWYAKSTDSVFSSDPFWGIFWPGGEALARYILDHKKLFRKKRILDIGSGSGACALAAAKCEADFVVANDIDPCSISAIHINARLNNLSVYTNGDNIIGEDIDTLIVKVRNEEFYLTWDVVLIGDMFYDTEFSTKLFRWLIQLVKKGKLVLVGDPGRHSLKDLESMRDLGTMIKIKDYNLLNKEHNGFSHGSVFREIFKGRDALAAEVHFWRK